MEKIKKSGLLIIILILIDQLTKIIVNIFLKDVSFRVLNGRLGFDVYLNKDYMSMFNRNFGLNLSALTLTLINIGILLFLISLYLYVLKNDGLNKKIRICIVIVIAAALCSIIDKIFWGGSLDYIVSFGYIYDLKDVMLYFGVILGIILFLYKYQIKKIDLNEIENLSYSGYFKYLLKIFS